MHIGVITILFKEGKIVLELLTVKELARELKVTEPWIYRKVKAGELPYLRIGGLLRFQRTEISKWLQGNVG